MDPQTPLDPKPVFPCTIKCLGFCVFKWWCAKHCRRHFLDSAPMLHPFWRILWRDAEGQGEPSKGTFGIARETLFHNAGEGRGGAKISNTLDRRRVGGIWMVPEGSGGARSSQKTYGSLSHQISDYLFPASKSQQKHINNSRCKTYQFPISNR